MAQTHCSETEGQSDCPICLGPLKSPCQAACGHVFCRRCIIQAFAMRPPSWAGECVLCRRPASMYSLMDPEGNPLARPSITSLFGCVFVQRSSRLGFASYHFDAEDDCYISYEGAPNSWRLDDGSKPPERKPFQDCRYDPSTRTFQGVVDWDPPFFGDTHWEYTLTFAEDFSAVVDGVMTGHGPPMSFRPPWQPHEERCLSYLRWTPPPADVFGSVYVQGMHYADALEGVASYHFDSEADCYISYARAPDSWCLDDGSRPPDKKPFRDCSYDAATRTFRAVVDWEPGFQGASHCEYELVFAEDFSSVSGGRVLARDADPPSLRFLAPGTLPDGPCLYYVRRPGIYSQFLGLACE